MLSVIGKLLFKLSSLCSRFINKYNISQMAAHGLNVKIEGKCNITSKNIYCGNNVFIGPNACFISSKANIYIGNNVMMGPNVMIVTGNHRTDVVGKYMIDVHEKTADDDRDVVIEDDVWIGMGAMILKGVTIGRGSVIGAGAIVSKSVPPYSVAYSYSNLVLKERFTPEEIREHERILEEAVSEK